MRIRYSGSDDARDLAIPGGCIQFKRGEWVDLTAACTAAAIPLHHLDVIVPNLGPDWEIEQPKPVKKGTDQ